MHEGHEILSADVIEAPWLAGAVACAHGSRCSCRAFAAALGLDVRSIDYNYCRRVLQKHWRMRCDHLPDPTNGKRPIQLPPHDAHDPVHAVLLLNTDFK